MTRRNFGIFGSCVIGLATLSGLGIKINAKPNLHLRPPGAVDRFDSLCIKCGQCVQVCPYHSIELLGFDDGINLATAYIDANKRGCYLCDLFPCVLACPSGALAHETTTIDDVKMGVAVVKSEFVNSCYANLEKKVSNSDISELLKRKTYNEREEKAKEIIANNEGKICELCVNSCPVPKAIEFVNLNENSQNLAKLPKINESCVGCGVCVEVCFANVIEIIPNATYAQIYKKEIL